MQQVFAHCAGEEEGAPAEGRRRRRQHDVLVHLGHQQHQEEKVSATAFPAHLDKRFGIEPGQEEKIFQEVFRFEKLFQRSKYFKEKKRRKNKQKKMKIKLNYLN